MFFYTTELSTPKPTLLRRVAGYIRGLRNLERKANSSVNVAEKKNVSILNFTSSVCGHDV
jgi:hypothetical protein